MSSRLGLVNQSEDDDIVNRCEKIMWYFDRSQDQDMGFQSMVVVLKLLLLLLTVKLPLLLIFLL